MVNTFLDRYYHTDLSSSGSLFLWEELTAASGQLPWNKVETGSFAYSSEIEL